MVRSIRVSIVTMFWAYCVELCCFLICLCLVALSISLCQPALYQWESQTPFQPSPSVIPVAWLFHTSLEWYNFFLSDFVVSHFIHCFFGRCFLSKVPSVVLTLVVHCAHVWWHYQWCLNRSWEICCECLCAFCFWDRQLFACLLLSALRLESVKCGNTMLRGNSCASSCLMYCTSENYKILK